MSAPSKIPIISVQSPIDEESAPTSAMVEDSATTAEKFPTEHTPNQWWKPITIFFVDAVVGLSLFALIAVPAIAMNLSIDYLAREYSLGKWLVFAFQIVEYSVLAADLIVFLVFLFRTSSRAIHEL